MAEPTSQDEAPRKFLWEDFVHAIYVDMRRIAKEEAQAAVKELLGQIENERNHFHV